MSGHQAQFWHTGIFAKHAACTHAAARHNAHAAWMVVDTDEPEFPALRYPAKTPDGALAERVWKVAPAETLATLGPSPVAAGARAFDPLPVAHQAADTLLPSVANGLDTARTALHRHRGAATAAEQVAKATDEVAAALTRAAPPTLIFASRLCRTALFEQLVSRIAANPRACHAAYNTAVSSTPGAGLVPLASDRDGSRLELPLWRIDERGSRHRVWSTDLLPGAMDTPFIARLAPRALLLTGLLRLAACDLFIHGMGGAGTDGAGGYDRATVLWFQSWLGEALAPCAVATGTLLLPLLDRTPTSAADVAAARFAAHHARHTPATLGEWGADREKRSIVAAIVAAREKPLRARLFRRMQTLLGEVRASHGSRLSDLARRADTLAASARAEHLAADRTWPFVLHDAAALVPFSGMIRTRLEANA